MKFIVAGGREIEDYAFVSRCILQNPNYPKLSEIVEGGARGVDSLARRFAEENRVKVRRFQADWLRSGKAAGPIRNEQMVEYALAATDGGILIAIPSPKSIGTNHIIKYARERNLIAFVHPYASEA